MTPVACNPKCMQCLQSELTKYLRGFSRSHRAVELSEEES